MTSYMTSSIRNDLKVEPVMSFICIDLSVEIQTHKRTKRTLILYENTKNENVRGKRPFQVTS